MSCLKWSLNNKKLMIILSVILMISPIVMGVLGWLKVDFIPADDSGRIQVNIKAPDGTSYPAMKEFMDTFESEIKQLPYITKVMKASGISASSVLNTGNATNKSHFLIELAPLKERPMGYSAFNYIDALRKIISKYDGITSSIFVQSDSPGGNMEKVQYIITGPDFNKLYEYATKMAEKVSKIKGIIDSDNIIFR